MKKPFLIAASLLVVSSIRAQRFSDQLPPVKRYDTEEVLDSSGSIRIYDRLIGSIGGDSVRYNRDGYSLVGWCEDFYKSGKLLHRGFYKDGQLISFRNFFENGVCERLVTNPDPLHCVCIVYHNNGNLRSEISYYNGRPQKVTEYYESGLPRYSEENEKGMKYLTRRRSWYSDGTLRYNLELVDLRAGKYQQTNYYGNGQVREEGPLVFVPATSQYLRDGQWLSYDANGKNKQTKNYSKETPIPDSSQ